MTDLFDEPDGATPLDAADQEGLIPTWIATRGDLNLAEQENIARAQVWVFRRSWRIADVGQASLIDLHRRMFRDVWRWAGSYRRSDTNLGVPWYQISVAVENLIRDLHVQTVGLDDLPWSRDEVSIRFHHRLVLIHAFPNGNGRHARLAADIVVIGLGGERFSWGAGAELSKPGTTRREYLDALRLADSRAEYEPLVEFARR